MNAVDALEHLLPVEAHQRRIEHVAGAGLAQPALDDGRQIGLALLHHQQQLLLALVVLAFIVSTVSVQTFSI